MFQINSNYIENKLNNFPKGKRTNFREKGKNTQFLMEKCSKCKLKLQLGQLRYFKMTVWRPKKSKKFSNNGQKNGVLILPHQE